MDIGQMLNEYLYAQNFIYDYFGYVEKWRVFPIDDRREYFWQLNEDETEVEYYDTQNIDAEEEWYSDSVYTQRHLDKWVYRAADFTMILVDTMVDGNKFLAIYDNAKEVVE